MKNFIAALCVLPFLQAAALHTHAPIYSVADNTLIISQKRLVLV